MGCRHRDRDKDVDTLDLAQKIEKDMIIMCIYICPNLQSYHLSI